MGRVFWRLITAALLVLGACTSEEMQPRQARLSPEPSPTQERRRLCQPFPDRLIDEFVSAYNDRDEEALQQLVTDRWIDDTVASGYNSVATFEDVRQWAHAGWNVDDVLDLVGYGAFNPTKWGFQMLLTRRSDALREEGIPAVSVALDAISRGCSIESFAMSGNVQARGDPCRFYEAFGASPEVGGNEPPECQDGSGDHARDNHVMVWTRKRALIWGGHRGGLFDHPDVVMSGLSYNPRTRRWASLPAPPFRHFMPQVGVWTGTEMLVVGASTNRKSRTVAAAYNPATSTWRWIRFPYRKDWSGFEAAWTGRELILWGGPSQTRSLERRGAIYDPSADEWRRTAPAPVMGRDSHVVVWTGAEMIVWGGGNWRTNLDDGAAYDPATDSWRVIAEAPILGRQWLPGVWTGTEMIVWGGSFVNSRRDGAAYNPATDTWRKLARAPIGRRHYHSATWTGTEMIVFGGQDFDHPFDDGAAYDSASDTWRRIPDAPIAGRFTHTAIWDGRRLFVFGGNPGWGHMASGDGALYDPQRNVWTERVIPQL